MVKSTIKPEFSRAIAQPLPQATYHHQIVIIGGGTAGITTASLLFKQNPALDIAIIEPSEKHYYQSGWTLVGGGVLSMADTTREQQAVMPEAATWIKDKVIQLEPDQNRVITASNLIIEYTCLIVCPGIQIDWHKIPGLKESLGQDGVTSNYSLRYAPYTWELMSNFKGGKALFTFPNTPIKCGGAPQKIMYLADDTFRVSVGVREHTEVMYFTPGNRMFGVPEYAHLLDKVVERRNIQKKFRHNLKEIQSDTRTAIFDLLDDHCQVIDQVSYQYDMIHVGPPQSAPDFIKNSPLAMTDNSYGWVDVHPHTLQHYRYSNVFSLGDASSLPTSKTAAAIRKQAPVLAGNLLAYLAGKSLVNEYDGYTCCPLVTGYNRLIMAEFSGYTCKPLSSFPLNPIQESSIMWLMEVYGLPWIYWHRMLTGKRFEGDFVKAFRWRG